MQPIGSEEPFLAQIFRAVCHSLFLRQILPPRTSDIAISSRLHGGRFARTGWDAANVIAQKVAAKMISGAMRI